MANVLIIGYGEIGRPLFEIVRGVHSRVEWLDIQEKKTDFVPEVVHITFPENNHASFVSASVSYAERFSPDLLLIESTVTPGTTQEIHSRVKVKTLVCHSPVRGNIKEGMKQGLFQYTKFIGPTSPEAAKRAREYYEGLGMKTCICLSPLETELGKVFETTYRGLMMSWFQEIHRICKHFAVDYHEVVEFIGSTEREGKQARPVFHPGVIGGHCILPNAERLYAMYPSKFVQALLESNRQRQKELATE